MPNRFSIRGVIGRSYNVDPLDVVRTKHALSSIGVRDPRRRLDDIPDNDLFTAIEDFQRARSLSVDGLMRPGGPTETAIRE